MRSAAAGGSRRSRALVPPPPRERQREAEGMTGERERVLGKEIRNERR